VLELGKWTKPDWLSWADMLQLRVLRVHASSAGVIAQLPAARLEELKLIAKQFPPPHHEALAVLLQRVSSNLRVLRLDIGWREGFASALLQVLPTLEVRPVPHSSSVHGICMSHPQLGTAVTAYAASPAGAGFEACGLGAFSRREHGSVGHRFGASAAAAAARPGAGGR
jgi:hypothetical protein